MLKRLKEIGPGAMVAAAFIGPGTVTTATFAGSSYGFTLLWAMVFSIAATYLLQEMSSRLGVVGQMGVGEAIRVKVTTPLFKIAASVLVIGAILIGNAAYEAGNITGAALGFGPYLQNLDFPFNPLVLVIGILAFALLFTGRYKLIERSLVLMVSIMGLVFLLAALLVQPDWGQVFLGILNPEIPDNALLMVIGLIGTTVVPYNLFLHAASVKQRWSGAENLPNSRWDTAISVILGGLITMAIIITASVAFSGTEKTIQSAADLGISLQPLLGDWATIFIAFGFLAAGLSSSVTAPLAAAFATSEILGWPNDLKGRNFRLVWIVVLVIGVVFSTLGFKPTLVILFAQIANGLLLPIIATFLLWIMNDEKIMGEYVNSRLTNILGGIVIMITLVLGLRGILSAINVI